MEASDNSSQMHIVDTVIIPPGESMSGFLHVSTQEVLQS